MVGICVIKKGALMDTNENKLVLSVSGKRKYLEKLIGKMIKILHLIQEEPQTHTSPQAFIYGQLIELNSANQLFDNELIEIIVKLNIVYTSYQTAPFAEIKKQIFEIKNKINYLLEQM